jgi:hypothetical protein
MSGSINSDVTPENSREIRATITKRWATFWADGYMQGTDRQRGQITRISAERDRLRGALEAAAKSLETISEGYKCGLDDIWNIRGYAHSRSRVAFDALASTEEKE